MKKTILLIIALIASIFSGYSAQYFEVFQTNFEHEVPTNIFVSGAECTNNQCSQVNSNVIEVYNGVEAVTCWNNYLSNNNVNQFTTCLDDAQLGSNIHPISQDGDYIVVKYNIPSSLGFLTHFSPQGDSYAPKFDRANNFDCNFDICFSTQIVELDFIRLDNAIAEVGQVNIKNIDNELLPVQVEVPVQIEETICSAYRFTNPNAWRPSIPSGYSDYQANTLIDLTITNANTNAQYYFQSITLPIEANTCAGLAAFTWQPHNGLLNEDVKFRIQSEVIDNQVENSLIDWHEVTERIYPQELNNAAWTRAYDFTLSNIESTDLTTSVAQITQGESLYALFNAGAWTGDDITPINFVTTVEFNGNQIYSSIQSSADDLSLFSLDLTNNIQGLQPGSYEVTLTTTPYDPTNQYDLAAPVIQTQALELLVPETFEVEFVVRDANLNPLNNANINLELLEVDDYFVNEPSYNINLNTNNNGRSTFTGVYRGDYTYQVSKSGHISVTNNVHIGSDTTIYITLPESNVAPIIDLPNEYTQYYENPIQIDIEDYVNDFNDAFEDLTITYQITTGTAFAAYSSNILTITTTTPNTATLSVTVEDPSGLTNTDTTTLNFIDNQVPVINEFIASPDNGAEPFTTNFVVDVTDLDDDTLTCTIYFGDGTQTTNSCNNLNNVEHTYTNVGTFNAQLEVNDGFNSPIYANEQVFVFQRVQAAPQIDTFTLSSSNGDFLPTNLTFNFEVSHEDNLPLECSIRINGVSNTVDCNSGIYNINNFNVEGTSRFSLIVFDGTYWDSRIIDRTFTNPTNAAPVINYFTLDSTNGNLIPTNLTLSWDATSPVNSALNCNLEVNGVTQNVLCSDSLNINNYNTSGNAIFNLTVNDAIGNEIYQVIEELFGTAQELRLDDIKLSISKTITPGSFKFNILTDNETLRKRQLLVEPTITCNSVTNRLKTSNKKLSTSAKSSILNNIEQFEFSSNTNDYELNIPKDTDCMFTTTITDSYGTQVELSEIVQFSYPIETKKLQSIRGTSLDITDFMSSILQGNINRGYNSIEFNIENNELNEKEVSITLIANQLGINYRLNENLGPGASRAVQVPLFIGENVKSGTYPIRIGTNDGETKQTRYSYIKIK